MNISVIVPVYNVEQYLQKCIESILAQSYKDFEIIIIDDGSTDCSLHVAKETLNGCPVPYKIIEQENKGVSCARNKGFENSTGKYVIFIDSDDVISRTFLEDLYEGVEDNRIDISISSYIYIKELNYQFSNENKQSLYFEKNVFLNRFLTRKVQFILPTMLIKRSLIKKNNIFFDSRIRFSEDQMYMWDVIFCSNRIKYIAKKNYGYFLRPNSTMTSSNYKKIISSYPFVLEKLSNSKKMNCFGDFKYALPRWKLGALYTGAKLLSYRDFMKMSQIMEADKIYKELKGFPEQKAKSLSFLLKISLLLFYYICKVVI